MVNSSQRSTRQPLVQPAVVDFWARHLSRTWSISRTLARVVSRRMEARDTVSLVLEPNRRFAGFLPGQHVNVTLEVDGVRLTRSYSLTGIPGRDRRLHLTIKAVPGGRVSQHLCHETRVGDLLELGNAYGDLVLPDKPPKAWLFLAAGSGITPIMSLIRALTADPLQVDLTLMYWARTRADLCFLAELRRLAGRDPRFRLVPVLTREAERLNDETAGRPDAEHFAPLQDTLARCRTYACGPAGFVDRIEALVAARVETFLAESFTPRPLRQATKKTVRVTHARRGETLELPAGVPLLTALEDAGQRPTHGCRLGVCNTCACAKAAGVTEDLRSGQVQSEAQSALKLCVSAAHSDLVLDW